MTSTNLFGRFQDAAAPRRLEGRPEDQPQYADWIRTHTSEDYETMAAWAVAPSIASHRGFRRLGKPRSRRSSCQSQRYEYLFGNMAFRREEWLL